MSTYASLHYHIRERAGVEYEPNTVTENRCDPFRSRIRGGLNPGGFRYARPPANRLNPYRDENVKLRLVWYDEPSLPAVTMTGPA